MVREITNRIVSTYTNVSLWSNTRETGMKILGIGICLRTVLGAAATVGIHLYFDVLSFLFALGGAIGFVVMKNNSERYVKNFGHGAVYFGWLGALIGLVAITGDDF